MHRAVAIVMSSALAVTSACSTVGPGTRVDQAAAEELVSLCLDQTQAPGAYNWQYDGRLPVAMSLPEAGGTSAGANMVNACVRQNAVLYADDPETTPVATSTGQADPVLSDPEPTPPSAVQQTGAQTPAAKPAETQPTAPTIETSSRPVNGVCPAGITGLYRGTIIC